MALVIYPTTNYDSFITIAEANDIVLKYTLDSATWTGLADADKEAYLRIAFRTIVDGLDVLPTDPVSDCVKQSQALIAIHDVVNGISKKNVSATGSIKKRKVGTIEEQYYEAEKKEYVYLIPRLAMPCLIELGWSGSANIKGLTQTLLGRS